MKLLAKSIRSIILSIAGGILFNASKLLAILATSLRSLCIWLLRLQFFLAKNASGKNKQPTQE